MPHGPVDPPFEFMATAEAVAKHGPRWMRSWLGSEAATLLHNGLALDGLDDHDTASVVAGLCVDLVAREPGEAVRARAQTALDSPEGLHDPEGVSAAYLIAARILQL